MVAEARKRGSPSSSSPGLPGEATPRAAGLKHKDGALTSTVSPSPYRSKELNNLADDPDSSREVSLEEMMLDEKKRYPGANKWSKAEQRLFEILFLRQDLPMLPPTWDVDLRDVPLSDAIFQTSVEFPPIIYARSKDFRATMALTRLIELTANVRTNMQLGHRQRSPALIKRELDRYISWAAQDGGYARLRTVPNLVTEVVDPTMPQDEITEYMVSRMHALARLQREFLREDRNPEFWDVVKPTIMTSPRIKVEPETGSPTLGQWPQARYRRRHASQSDPDELASTSPPSDQNTKPPRKRRLFNSSPPGTDIDELSENHYEQGGKKRRFNTTPKKEDTLTHGVNLKKDPETPSKAPSYRRHPPVVYGLFILKSNVLLLTIDSSKGDDAYVSYYVQANFEDQHQSVWNALTVALVACLARDELMTRASDFEELPYLEESDPDA